MIRVLLADDQAVIRDGLSMLLGTSDRIEVVGAVGDGAQAVELCAQITPDVALLDLRMPVLDGAAATAQLRERAPGTRVLILTTYADDSSILPALRAGAAGYLTKDTGGDELIEAIVEVAAGRTVLDPTVQRRLVELATATPLAPPDGVGPGVGAEPIATPAAATAADLSPDDAAVTQGLTRREVDVVRLVADGLTNRQIARQLVVSEATVKTHLNHLLAKLDVDGRPGLVAWAWRHGFGSS